MCTDVTTSRGGACLFVSGFKAQIGSRRSHLGEVTVIVWVLFKAMEGTSVGMT